MRLQFGVLHINFSYFGQGGCLESSTVRTVTILGGAAIPGKAKASNVLNVCK